MALTESFEAKFLFPFSGFKAVSCFTPISFSKQQIKELEISCENGFEMEERKIMEIAFKLKLP